MVLGKNFEMKIIEKSSHCKVKEIINEINIFKKYILLQIFIQTVNYIMKLKKENNFQKLKQLLKFIKY